ncbi:MarR family transcriptional regulator [Flavobacterium sp. MFBS3-15]|uniref:MarR family winged helix-turn-helix transcriptional regulator n=1 Tax=Flavobacterium sp. MFBS3-15 TaxID=2989816 RepID=UPI002235566A|nr:MarR family transcriptional regulator [Flavobacterium sp. MFBS3-15]MCW4470894.1 MarR family transcriptional regulator [Flavobacterium sp. MFBS3-15]
MENLNSIVFYTIDKAIKSYRQFAQKQLKDAGFNLTIDQWLVLKALEQDSNAPQQQIAATVFKDVASITRIIELLVQKGYLIREFHSEDRRRFKITLTDMGNEVLKKMQPHIIANRNTALKGITHDEIKMLQETLSKIAENVT